ncbi:MAG TPA: transposase [Acidobacteriota bacterium]|nr:transposase [Acidobacteriota bacterium]HNG95369.1 transposase [Acidobacteriota bacterium]
MSQCGVKFKANPTGEQKRILSEWMGCARFVYNAKVEEMDYFWTFRQHNLALTGYSLPIDQTYSQFKTELTPWLSDCPSQILRNAVTKWYEAFQRFRQGKSGLPVKKKKGKRDSILLTNELFRLDGVEDQETGKGTYKLFVGSEQNNLGYLSFEAHREFEFPNSVTISRKNGDYFVSFSYEDGRKAPTEEELIGQYGQLDEATLGRITLGIDRGVVNPVYTSDGEVFDFTQEQKASQAKADHKIEREQRKLARQKDKGSRRRERTKRKIAKAHSKKANIRRDFAHQTSRKLVDSDKQILVVEDLKIANLTAAPEPKPADDGKTYLPNGAAAKAGLNKSILQAGWGMLVTFVTYKAFRCHKLVLKVPPHHSSQECAECGHTHPDNRPSQSEFVCGRCGHIDHADHNGARVVGKRGIKKLQKSVGVNPPSPPAGTRGSARRGTVRRRKESRPAQPETPVSPKLERSANRPGEDRLPL